MGYDTRRKQVNWVALGIELPQTHAEKAAARLSPPSIATSTSEHHISKKSKRARRDSCSLSPPPKRIYTAPKDINTPPLSPPAEVHEFENHHDDEMKEKESKREKLEERKVKREEGKDEKVEIEEIDLAEVKDEIVEGVIVQLQKTANRPHLVKELAAILSPTVRIVEQSANPCAIISSRLSNYLKRSWSVSSPCPVGKELETVHPRRTYFYLTTYPHQPIPDPSQLPQRTIITPSISSADSVADEPDRSRCDSPEVDLSSEEYDDDDSVIPPTPTGSFSGRFERPVRNNRASSVGLEKDEKEFTQTARGMQKRRFSGEPPSKPSDMTDMPSNISDTPMKSVESDPFFGESRGLTVSNTAVFMNSPAMKPVFASKKSWDSTLETSHTNWAPAKIETLDWDTRSPENVELDELDGMLDGY
ncbi:hypothetical protein OCU04_010321 [Sclerotinia nivalis]|uniref:GDS1 winged helix domain-containing protein n=1 Tax=Sclerotinia nivalis TaxID=352851 RepID=A0A9X0AEH3_9HELO|nr:hypothetical protein OCU04_010321 [Sclerotinia nivalis]